MQVVITGGTGFLGLALARRLTGLAGLTGVSGRAEAIDEIVLFDRTVPDAPPSGLDRRARLVADDVTDRQAVEALIDDDDVAVFHLASVVSAGAERDFDLAMGVNLDGGRNVLEAVRRRAGVPRVVFASSIATFGGTLPDVVSDSTKHTPQTTYGMTKVIGELMINDYSRKRFIDGRTARLPTVIVRPGKPNAAASSFASGVFREPLDGAPCVLPVTVETRVAVIGLRTCVDGLITLYEVDGAALGPDRAVNLPALTVSVAEMMEAVGKVAAERGRDLGPITVVPDPDVQRIVDSWPARTEAGRARALGLSGDEGLERIVSDYIDDFLAQP
ncbi:MAG: NAD-dependent epimerase/dehydratase family protein [Rhodospirillales bacterium]|jgi:nucleoside-diphosphate-sugar epimerase|nr:NAD-dependent epimerase/dehydratase family protein [Rhodospirillales bacterium]